MAVGVAFPSALLAGWRAAWGRLRPLSPCVATEATGTAVHGPEEGRDLVGVLLPTTQERSRHLGVEKG